mmetsp:Transcript_115302/g.290183  ORF Transcript_115302/g.290183 Transcript_115302/m.290183 type:complete len:206 (-) Transcript_115302:674-1291(-)
MSPEGLSAAAAATACKWSRISRQIKTSSSKPLPRPPSHGNPHASLASIKPCVACHFKWSHSGSLATLLSCPSLTPSRTSETPWALTGDIVTAFGDRVAGGCGRVGGCNARGSGVSTDEGPADNTCLISSDLAETPRSQVQCSETKMLLVDLCVPNNTLSSISALHISTGARMPLWLKAVLDISLRSGGCRLFSDCLSSSAVAIFN